MFRFWAVLMMVFWTIYALSASTITFGTTFPIHGDIIESKSSLEEHKGNTLNLEDYHEIDPVPTSKESVKSGPIEHGTPLMPYIPKPSPPYHPIYAMSPSPI